MNRNEKLQFKSILCIILFEKRKEPVPLTKRFVGRQIFHGFSYCAPGATKRQPVSSLSVQGLPASVCGKALSAALTNIS